ncbi:MAG: 50S ribosome-binding GTPase, partial [Rikenellaceae bacterium]|nr:50S ribosome-binding GTPase [Rikenellaceae bacterium]
MGKVNAGRENKPHIGIFGRCNAGKSTLFNFLTDTRAAIVSPRRGTTTDPVKRSCEILGFGPVVFIDTGGTDDDSPLADQRIAAAMEAARLMDLAIIVFREWGEPERVLAAEFMALGLPFISVGNRVGNGKVRGGYDIAFNILDPKPSDRDAVMELIKKNLPEESYRPPSMLGNLVGTGDRVVLVCQIDSEAPAGRIILPLMQAVREVLDRNARG